MSQRLQPRRHVRLIVPDSVGLGLELFDESNTSSRVTDNVETGKVFLVRYSEAEMTTKQKSSSVTPTESDRKARHWS